MLKFLQKKEEPAGGVVIREEEEIKDGGDVPVIDLSTHALKRDVGQILPEMTSRKISGICVGNPSDGWLSVAVKDPTQIYIYDHVEIGTQGKYKAVLLKADPAMIDLAFEYIYKTPATLQHQPWDEWMQAKKFATTSVGHKGQQIGPEITEAEAAGTAIEAADRVIKEAISVNASDIHIETYPDVTLIRYRMDGVLQTMNQLDDRKAARALVKRLKVMANMDIAQERTTQGGRISIEIGGKGFDLRVSCVPVPTGECLVLRVLHKGAFSLTLGDLGFTPEQQKRYEKFISRPHGIVLACGPTGSGKSTTLYASLKTIARPDRKLLTVEDPIEYEMPGIVQVQVNMAPTEVEKRVTFAGALREFLRQDPDVILVGEIRDAETANISVQAALTGHLVLSTIHTNDAVGIINRLKDQGVKPYLIAATLLGGVAQRLVRRICKDCKTEISPTDEQKKIFEANGIAVDKVAKGEGCTTCRRSGYKGRIALYEILTMSHQIRELVERDAVATEIARMAKSQGMKTLLLDGLDKASRGLVTVDEVLRVATEED
jgi:type IV pilus assembly protein PilB